MESNNKWHNMNEVDSSTQMIRVDLKLLRDRYNELEIYDDPLRIELLEECFLEDGTLKSILDDDDFRYKYVDRSVVEKIDSQLAKHEHARHLLKEGMRHRKAANYTQAIELLEEYCSYAWYEDFFDVDVLFELEVSYREINDTDGERRTIIRAIEKNEEGKDENTLSGYDCENLSNFYGKLGDTKKEIEYCKLAIDKYKQWILEKERKGMKLSILTHTAEKVVRLYKKIGDTENKR